MKKIILLFIILSSCSTPNSRSDAYYEAVAGHIAQTVLSGDCNSKWISSIVSSDLKYATYTQAINVIDKVSKLLPSIYDAIKKELVVRVDEKYKGIFFIKIILTVLLNEVIFWVPFEFALNLDEHRWTILRKDK